MSQNKSQILHNQPVLRKQRAHRERVIILTALLIVLCFSGYLKAHANELKDKAFAQRDQHREEMDGNKEVNLAQAYLLKIVPKIIKNHK